MMQRWSRCPLIGRSQVQFLPSLPMCQSVPHIAPGGYKMVPVLRDVHTTLSNAHSKVYMKTRKCTFQVSAFKSPSYAHFKDYLQALRIKRVVIEHVLKVKPIDQSGQLVLKSFFVVQVDLVLTYEWHPF